MKYENLSLIKKFCVFLFIILGCWYLIWRLGTFNDAAPIFSRVLYGAEVFGFFVALLHVFMTYRLSERKTLEISDDKTVDVFITCYNEPVEIIRRSLMAAIGIKYPHKTWLLDDGNRPELKQMAERLGAHYIARDENIDAKAGNLNNALQETSGEFVAVFDADHAACPHFIEKTLGYFSDEKVAFVQTPQSFYNRDSFQHRFQNQKTQMWTEQSLFFQVIQRGKDTFNAVLFCGCSAIIRRSALEKINGFATGTVTEDLHTSVRLHQAGYKSVYTPEALAFGIAPQTIEPFLQQRIRWGQGAMQVLRKEKLFIFSGMSIRQKLSYIASIVTYFEGWQKGIFYIAPVVVLLFGLQPITTNAITFLLHFIPYYVFSFVVFEILGRGYGRTVFNEEYNFFRFAAFAWATLGLFLGKLKFKVTKKTTEKSSRKWHFFWPQYLIMGLNILALLFAIVWFNRYTQLSKETIIFNMIWAGLTAAIAIKAMLHSIQMAKFQRKEYRFNVPIPVEIKSFNSNVYGVVQNISPDGFCIQKVKGSHSVNGSSISGHMLLPNGRMPFNATVCQTYSESVAMDGDEEQAIPFIRCQFVWENFDNRDMIEKYLFGTDAESHVHQVSSKSMFLSHVIEQVTHKLTKKRWWSARIYQSNLAENDNSNILMALTDERRSVSRLISYSACDKYIKLSIDTLSGIPDLVSVEVGELTLVRSHLGNLYMYDVVSHSMSSPDLTLDMEDKNFPIPNNPIHVRDLYVKK